MDQRRVPLIHDQLLHHPQKRTDARELAAATSVRAPSGQAGLDDLVQLGLSTIQTRWGSVTARVWKL